MGGDHVHLARRPLFTAIGSFEAQSRYAPIRTDLHVVDDGSVEQLGSGALGPADVNGGVVLRLYRADGNAAPTAAAGRPIVVRRRVACLRSRHHHEARRGQRGRHARIEVARGNGRERIWLASVRAEIRGPIPCDAERPLRVAIPRLEVVVADRPIHSHAKARSQPEVVGHHPQRRPEPVPRRPADLPEIRGTEYIRAVLHVVGVFESFDGVRRVWGVRIRRRGHLDERTRELVERLVA